MRTGFFLCGRIQKVEGNYRNLFGNGPEEHREDDEGSSEPIATEPRVKGFVAHWGWVYVTYQLSQFYMVKEDEIDNWNVYRYLNSIAFMKDKYKYDLELQKEAYEDAKH